MSVEGGKEVTAIFRPNVQIEVSSPEELFRKAVGIHPNEMTRLWGEGAVDRYNQARIEAKENAPRPE